MLNRVLFAVRRFPLRAGQWLGSWRLSIVLMVVAAFYYGLLAIWAGSSPAPVVRNIASLLPFWIVYALILANTAVCLWRRLPLLRRQLATEPIYRERRPDWELAAQEASRDDAARSLRRSGFRVVDGEDGNLVSLKYRWAALGTYLFHGAFFLLAAGFLLTMATRREARVWAAEGETFTGADEQFLSASPPTLLATGGTPPTFVVERITPVFWEELLLFTNLEAELILASGERAVTRINRPVWLGWGTFVRLSGFGYTPRYELLDRDGRMLDSAFVKMNVFPPGQRDFFKIPDLPHRFYVEVLPDFALQEGEAVTQSLNLVNPAVRVHAVRGRLDLGQALLRQEEAFDFEGLSLRIPEIRYWGELTIVQDPGAPVIFSGFLLGMMGLLLRIRGGRQEVVWRPSDGGSGGTFQGWGGEMPRRLEESLS